MAFPTVATLGIFIEIFVNEVLVINGCPSLLFPVISTALFPTKFTVNGLVVFKKVVASCVEPVYKSNVTVAVACAKSLGLAISELPAPT
jgi:hypothetical protein